MTTCFARAALLVAALLPAAWGQFELRAVDGDGEHAVPAIYAAGPLYSGETVSLAFRLRNTSAVPATLDFLEIAGAGFALSAAPKLPVWVQPQAAVEIAVRFQAPAPGAYSAAFRATGVSVLLTVKVLPWLTYKVDSGAGFQLLAAPVDFGTVERPAGAAIRHFAIENRMDFGMVVPAIAVQGLDFALAGAQPSGQLLQPGEGALFDVVFRPAAAGARTGTLSIGDRAYALIGTAVDPPPPAPRLTIDLAAAESARQGTATVRFEAPARTAGSGTLMLEFRPAPATASDPAIAFAAGGRTLQFKFSPGDTQVSAAFQTGTTAGTITFSAIIAGGDAADALSVAIQPASAGITASQAARRGGGIELEIAGFDNTRTAGPLTFTFFDAAGNVLAPGAIRTDASAVFATYFQASTVGGAFDLKAVFPVTGDVSQIAAFEAQLANSAGTATTGRIKI